MRAFRYFAGILAFVVRVVNLAKHLDVAADGEPGQAVAGIAPFETEAGNKRPDAQGEGLDLDAAPLGGKEVAQFMNEDQKADADDGHADAEESTESFFKTHA